MNAQSFLDSLRGDVTVTAELPGPKHEDWRFSDVRALHAMRFEGPAQAVKCAAATFAVSSHSHITTGNGFVDTVAVDGFVAGALASLPQDVQAVVRDVLGTASPWDDAFVELNDSSSVLAVVVAPGVVVDQPIHLNHWASGNAAVTHRTVVVAGREAKFTLVEDYRGEGAYFRNARTEVVVGSNAHVTHVRVQDEALGAAHLLRSGVRLSAHAHYDSYTVSCGAHWARHDLYARHEGEGTFCRIDGLVLARDSQTSDTHSAIDNTKPHCESHQLHKSIVGGRAHSIFNGKILVQKGAQKIDAYQLNRSLLLSPTAKVDTKPQLEILADDVRCTHGATVGQLDEEQVFYLKARGFDDVAARGMLTYAFAGEILEEIPVVELRERLEAIALSHTR